MKKISLWNMLGPGLLFAGTSIGVSHLIQSTRAGGIYGLAAILPICLAMLLKYPAFYFGPLYTYTTGNSLMTGYKKLGGWTIALTALVYLGTMFSVVAAISLMTSAFILASLGISTSPLWISFGLLILISLLSYFGGLSLIMKIVKYIVALMSLVIVLLFFLAIKQMDFSLSFASFTNLLAWQHFAFLLALTGWMPAGMDLPLLNSLWVVKHKYEKGISYKKDFDIGYVLTTLIAVGFVFIGTVVMFQRGHTLPDAPTQFAVSLLNVFTTLTGEGYFVWIALGFVAVLLSTLITVVDGFPRVLIELLPKQMSAHKKSLLFAHALQVSGASLIVFYFAKSLKEMIDFATILAFLSAPLFAYLNHRVVSDLAKNKQITLSRFMRAYSWVGIVFLSAFGIVYLFSLVAF